MPENQSSLASQVDLGKALAAAGLTAATVIFPGSGPAVALAGIGVNALAKLIIDGYDALMASRPPEVTEAEWRALLLHPVLTQSLDERLDAKLNPSPAPLPPIAAAMQSLGEPEL
jgi:hypothetical protein